ncbi:MAG: hypothetical protein AB8G05_14275 [Oligoflexales bacterium]
MLKKMIGSFTLTCTILASSQVLMPTQRADALIIAAFSHDDHTRHDCCIAGLICLFFIPPLGLILNSGSLIDNFDEQLPFLAQTHEGMLLKSELYKIGNSVKVIDGTLQIRTKQFKKIGSEGEIISKEDLLNRVEIIDNDANTDPKEKVNGQIALSRDFVEKVLNQGDYSDSEKDIAFKALCK